MAGHRIFGSKPGAYGAGLQALIDERIWTDRADLASAYVTWGAYAYGAKANGINDEKTFTERLKRIESAKDELAQRVIATGQHAFGAT